MQQLLVVPDAVEPEFKKGPEIPEHALLVALIENAIQDLRGCGVGRTCQTPNDARRWLLNRRDRSPFSFLWICEHLSMDSDSLRREILKRTALIKS